MWKIMKASSTGEHHIAEGRPCQDCYAVEQQSEDRLILAVADGHGGTPHSRSDIGARYACEAAVEILKDPDVVWADITERIKELFDLKVQAHLAESPLTEAEEVWVNGFDASIAYGTTLICCCITPEGVYRAQIGDGEIHVLTTMGAFLPGLREDENCVGFFTSSLVGPTAVKKFRWAYDEVSAAVVAMYTDGYSPRAHHPWNLLNLAESEFDDIPQDILEEGKHGDDQTVLLAIQTVAVKEPAFHDGYTSESARCALAVRRAALVEQIYSTDSVIKYYIQKLAKHNDIRLRNRLLEKLFERQKVFLALSEEYRNLIGQQEMNQDEI